MPLSSFLPNGLSSFSDIGETIGSTLEGGAKAGKQAARNAGKAASTAVETGVNMAVDAVNKDIDTRTGIAAGAARGAGKALDQGINAIEDLADGKLPGIPGIPGVPGFPGTSAPPIGTFIPPGFAPPVGIPPVIGVPTYRPPPAQRTATQLAERAINRLTTAPTAQVREAITTINALIKDRRLDSPKKMIAYLERKVRIGEVLQAGAIGWSAETHQDFADAFRMEVGKKSVKDSIVDIAVLNDEDLEDEIRAENIVDASPEDLMQDRRIVWQYPAPGTPLAALHGSCGGGAPRSCRGGKGY